VSFSLVSTRSVFPKSTLAAMTTRLQMVVRLKTHAKDVLEDGG